MLFYRPGHPQREAGLFDRDALTGQFGHEGEPDFWGTTCSTAAAALRRIFTSFSRSAIRAWTRAGAADSTAAGLGALRPHSIRSNRFQRCRQDSAIPSDAAASRTDQPDSSRSRARRRNSGG